MESYQEKAVDLQRAIEQSTSAVGEIITLEDLLRAKEVAIQIKNLRKTVEEEEDRVLEGAKFFIKEVQKVTRPVLTVCKNWEASLKEKIDAFLAKQAAEKKANEQVVVEAVNAGDIAGALEKLEAVEQDTGIQQRKVKELVIEDENIIPDEYWVLDTVKIRKMLMAGVDVPGAKLQEKIIGIVK